MRKLTLVVGLSLAGAAAVFAGPLLFPQAPSASLDAGSALQSGSLAVAVGIAFLGGLLTALTPCVYPLIPITVAVFSGTSERKPSRGRKALLTAGYVLGICVFFSGVGAIVARTGLVFGKWLSYPPVVIGLAVFFAILAASMFGAFELALPPGVALRLNRVGGAGLAGAFSMGLVAGVVAAPCTGPVLLGILAYIVKQQSVGLGLLLPFFYALGIGVPFFLIGVFSLSLGKSGPWMDAVKSLMGIALLALGLGYLRDAFPALERSFASDPRILYAATVAVGLGLLLGAVHLSFHGSWRERLLKAAGVALVVVGVSARFGFAGTAQAACLDPNDPACREGGAIAWVRDLDQGLALAKAAAKPAFIDFYADWCGACKELDQKTYPSPLVREAARRFVAIKVDGTRSSDALDATYDKYGIEGLPTVIFIDSKGNVLKDPKIVGWVSPRELVGELAKVK
ncbi:MAG: protein-disulfide reductase DsbD family protein [Myxococcales bacterium]